MRYAIYARYSDDSQNARSIEDQIRLCRERVTSLGGTVVETYTDPAISGASMFNRPGVQQLMAHARAGRFDAVIAEDMDRISRDLEDTAGIHKRLTHLGIVMITLSDGEITEMHAAFKGLMSARFLKDLAEKTRRGQRGNVENGLIPGGKSYGYDLLRELDDKGEVVRGKRRINEDEKAIVLEIFESYTAGDSPRAIAKALNRRSVPGPNGGTWTASTIIGNRARGTGILNNELYIGRLVHNRQRFVKDPDTGKRQARLNPRAQWIIKEMPEFRIVPQELWDRAEVVKGAYTKREKVQRRPRRLLSELIKCSECGGNYVLIGRQMIGCANHKERGLCSNGRLVTMDEVEERVFSGIKERLLSPEMLADVIAEVQAGLRASDAEKGQRMAALRKELREVETGIQRLISAIERGVSTASMEKRLMALEERRPVIEAEIAASVEPSVVQLHPGLADGYRKKVEDLQAALENSAERPYAAALFREMIDRIVLTPTPGKRARVELDVFGRIAGLLRLAEVDPSDEAQCRVLMVAGAGFEPATFRL